MPEVFGKGSITLGAAIHQAGVTLYDQSGDTYRNPLQTYTLFGDPALMINKAHHGGSRRTDFQEIYESSFKNYSHSQR